MLRRLSIRYKLMLLLVGILSVVLTAVSLAIFFSDVRALRQQMAIEYSTLTKVVAANSSAALSISDIDPSGAQQVVEDLRVESSIRFAALYDLNGTEVARYVAQGHGDVQFTPAFEFGPRFTDDGFLDVLDNVKLNDGKVIGRIFLRVSTERLDLQVRRTIGIVAAVYSGALVLAMLLSLALQRLISTPILSLAEKAQQVSDQHDYSLRAKKTSEDELGTLCDGFNTMLAEIQQRDAELRNHRLRLEETVELRTRQLRARTEELTRSNAELEQFAYIASHDLQEPLRKVQAFGDMLATQFRDVLPEEGRDYLQRMQGAAKRMQGLINDLLNYSRVKSKAQPFVPVNLNDVMHLVLADLEARLRDTSGRVDFGELPTLDADPTQMRQVLQNLIGNSLKYHRRDTVPVVTVRSDRLDPQESVCPGSGAPVQCVRLTIQDNGIGFEEKYAERIFAPFERLHGRSEYEGTGMGLAICRKIVERHGGTVTAHGVPNQGATFLVDLPLTQPKGDSDHVAL